MTAPCGTPWLKHYERARAARAGLETAQARAQTSAVRAALLLVAGTRTQAGTHRGGGWRRQRRRRRRRRRNGQSDRAVQVARPQTQMRSPWSSARRRRSGSPSATLLNKKHIAVANKKFGRGGGVVARARRAADRRRLVPVQAARPPPARVQRKMAEHAAPYHDGKNSDQEVCAWLSVVIAQNSVCPGDIPPCSQPANCGGYGHSPLGVLGCALNEWGSASVRYKTGP